MPQDVADFLSGPEQTEAQALAFLRDRAKQDAVTTHQPELLVGGELVGAARSPGMAPPHIACPGATSYGFTRGRSGFRRMQIIFFQPGGKTIGDTMLFHGGFYTDGGAVPTMRGVWTDQVFGVDWVTSSGLGHKQT
jgi:hypothetical protein